MMREDYLVSIKVIFYQWLTVVSTKQWPVDCFLSLLPIRQYIMLAGNKSVWILPFVVSNSYLTLSKLPEIN